MQTEHLEAEVERLRAEVARLRGDAAAEEASVLADLLVEVRRATDRLPLDSDMRSPLLEMGFGLARAVPGETSTVDEFAARAAYRREGLLDELERQIGDDD